VLEQITVSTRLGDVPLWGRFETFDAARPLVLVLRGAFAHVDYLDRLPDALEGCDVVLAHLPGMHSPRLVTSSVGAFARAFDECVRARFAGRQVLRVGISVGGLVVLAMREGAALVATDPPLTTASLGPLAARLRRAVAEDPTMADWVWNVFGIGPFGTEARDYSEVLRAVNVRGIVLMGDPFADVRLPGLMAPADQAMIAAVPGLEAVALKGVGHNIPRDAPEALLRAIRGACRALEPRAEA